MVIINPARDYAMAVSYALAEKRRKEKEDRAIDTMRKELNDSAYFSRIYVNAIKEFEEAPLINRVGMALGLIEPAKWFGAKKILEEKIGEI